MTRYLENTRTLCALPGVSGDEGAVREKILQLLDGAPLVSDPLTDAAGNLIVEIKGRARPKNRVLFEAHMDEVGFIITGADRDGFLRFDTVGGIDTTLLVGKPVVAHGLGGVIGAVPLHLLEGDQRRQVPKLNQLRIDIGARDAEEALTLLPAGSTAVFQGPWTEMGSLLRAKAIDDRLGCALLLELAHTELPYDLTLMFSTQEEIGTRGARTGAYRIAPDISVSIETTTAADIDGVEGDARVCLLGGGVVVPFMDGGNIYDRALYRMAREHADRAGIPNQTKTRVAGGTDAAAIAPSRGGVRTLGLAVAGRCLHSPACVIHPDDAQAMLDLALLLAAELPTL